MNLGGRPGGHPLPGASKSPPKGYEIIRFIKFSDKVYNIKMSEIFTEYLPAIVKRKKISLFL